MAQVESIKDAAESVVQVLRDALSPEVVAGDRVRLVTRDELKALPEPGRATVTVYLQHVALRHQLVAEDRRSAIPAELSLIITPWSDDAAWELILLGHILGAVMRHPLLTAPLRVGSTWREDDTLQLVDAGLNEEQATAVFLGLGVPSRPSVVVKAQIFAVEFGA